MSRAAGTMSVAIYIVAGACGRAPLADEAGAYYRWDDRSIHCAAEIDDSDQIPMDSIRAGLDRAQRDNSVLELLVHRPGQSMTRANFETLLDGIASRNLPFLTVKDLVAGPRTVGVALMFDDAYPDVWLGVQDLLDAHHAHVTLYITWYSRLQQSQRDQIRELATMGHDIEAHSVNHVRGPDYVEAHGLEATFVTRSFHPLRCFEPTATIRFRMRTRSGCGPRRSIKPS